MSESTSLTLRKIAGRVEFEAVRDNKLPEIHREYIIGITAAGSTLEDSIRYDPDVFIVGEAEIVLPSAHADRILDFYERCRVPPPEKSVPHDCHSFVAHVLGKRTLGGALVAPYYNSADILERLTSINDMQPGEAYVHIDHEKQPNIYTHSMFGTEDPSYNLAVMGVNQPLFIVGNQNSMKSYGGSIHHVNIAPSV